MELWVTVAQSNSKNGTMSDSGIILQSKMELWVTVAPSNSQKWNYEWVEKFMNSHFYGVAHLLNWSPLRRRAVSDSQISEVHKKGGQKGLKTLIRPYIFRKIFHKVPKFGKGGGQDSSHRSQVHKVPNLHRGLSGGWEFFPSFPMFEFWRLPLGNYYLRQLLS